MKKKKEKKISERDENSFKEDIKINDLIKNSSLEKSSESSISNASKKSEEKSRDNTNEKKFENSKSESNKNESMNQQDEKGENENAEVLSFKDKANEFINKDQNSNQNKDTLKEIDNGIISNHSSEKKISFNNANNMNNIANLFNINNKSPVKKAVEYNYIKDLTDHQKFMIDMKLKEKNNNININMNNSTQISKKVDLNQKSEQKSIDSNAFNQLKNLSLSLDNEKTYSNIFKKLNKDKSSNNYKEINNVVPSKSKRSTKYSQEMTSGSTNSNVENFFYPDVFYINEENNLHTKTHISLFFTKLKNRNNNSS